MNRHGPIPRHWIALAMLTLTATTAVLAALPSPPPPAPARSTSDAGVHAPPGPSRVRSTRPARRSHDPENLPPGSQADRCRVRTVARRFVAAFLAYEVRSVRHAVARGVRAAATPELARELLGRPPRLPMRGRARRARLLGLAGLRVRGSRAWVIARIARGRRSAGLVLELERRRGRFFVARVR